MEDYIDGSEELRLRCAYCEKDIAGMPMNVNSLSFCDVVCVRLYGVEHEWKNYYFSKQIYNHYYKNGVLTERAAQSYLTLRVLDFPFMPRYVSTNSDREAAKKYYYDVLLRACRFM